MVRPGSTSLWKAYGLNELPGLGSMNRHLKNTHGGGNERAEGIGQYSVPWGQPLAEVADAWQLPGAPIIKTGHPGYYMANRYDATTTQNAQTIPGFSPNSRTSPSPRQGLGATHLPSSSGSAAGHTCPSGQCNPGTIATQSSASEHKIGQRFMPDGQTDFSTEMQCEPAPPAVYPREPYYYQDAPQLASDTTIERMRRFGGGATYAEAQQGWQGLAMARRQAAMSNFSGANDSVGLSKSTSAVEARVAAFSAAGSADSSSSVITIHISKQTLEILAIVGGLIALIVVAFALRGIVEAIL